MQKSKRSGRVSPIGRTPRESVESVDFELESEDTSSGWIFFGYPECYWHTILCGVVLSVFILAHAYFPLLQEIVIILDGNYMYFDYLVVPTLTVAICTTQSLFVGLYYRHPGLLRPFHFFCLVLKVLLLPNAAYYLYRFSRVFSVLVYKQMTESKAECSWKCIEYFVETDQDLKTSMLLFAGLIFAVDASITVSKCFAYIVKEAERKNQL